MCVCVCVCVCLCVCVCVYVCMNEELPVFAGIFFEQGSIFCIKARDVIWVD